MSKKENKEFKGSKPYNRNRNKKNKNKTKNKERKLNFIFNFQKQLYWKNYKVDEFAKIDGDAYQLAAEINQEKHGPEPSQMRKFFDEALKGSNLLEENKDDEVIILLAMLPARVMYAKSRNVVDQSFVDFINTATDKAKFNIDSRTEFRQNYKQFILFFEALVGYHNYLKKGGYYERTNK